jgi:hypothetical protein
MRVMDAGCQTASDSGGLSDFRNESIPSGDLLRCEMRRIYGV